MITSTPVDFSSTNLNVERTALVCQHWKPERATDPTYRKQGVTGDKAKQIPVGQYETSQILIGQRVRRID